MDSGLGAYRAVLSDLSARSFSLAGFVARMPISMTGLGITLLVSIETGSFAQAGLATACGTAAGAVAAPAWGRLIDRIGQARVLISAAVVNSVSLGLLAFAVLAGAPLWLICLAAVGTGLGLPSAGTCVRARWSRRLMDSPLLNTAFAFEAVLDELVFILGPVIVTFLASAVHPAAGIGACLLLGLFGALSLASMRATQPPVERHRRRREDADRLPVSAIAPVVAVSVALGAVFGGMEVAIVAFAKQSGALGTAGVILMAWALGSLTAGVVTGTIQWKVSAARRLRVGALGLAVSIVPLPFAQQPVLVGFLLVVSGFAIAPTLIASVAVVQESVPAQRLTEALGWTTMGLGSGMALGAVVLGSLIEQGGARAGFLGLLGAGALLIVAALVVPAAAPTKGPGTEAVAATAATDTEGGAGDPLTAPPDTPATAPGHSAADNPAR